jgi:hypothetical protein
MTTDAEAHFPPPSHAATAALTQTRNVQFWTPVFITDTDLALTERRLRARLVPQGLSRSVTDS